MNRGTCGPWRPGMIICSTSKPTIAVGSSPSRSSGIFITRDGWSGAETRQSVAMLPWWMSSSSRYPSMTAPGSMRMLTGHVLPGSELATELQPRAKIARKARRPDLPRCLLGVVGNPVEDQHVGRLVEHRVAGRRVAVARLPHRAGDDQPAAERAELDGCARDRLEAGDPGIGRQVVQRGSVGVAGEDLPRRHRAKTSPGVQ